MNRPTLQELASGGGDDGVICPKCGCRHMLAENTHRMRQRTYRYRRCRNCGNKVLTREEIVRDVRQKETDSSGGENLELALRLVTG